MQHYFQIKLQFYVNNLVELAEILKGCESILVEVSDFSCNKREGLGCSYDIENFTIQTMIDDVDDISELEDDIKKFALFLKEHDELTFQHGLRYQGSETKFNLKHFKKHISYITEVERINYDLILH